MQITFGMNLDGVVWSDKEASSGEVKVGPFGTISLLETRLGLGGLTVHPAVRINQYMHRMEACDSPDKWFHASFKADSWSTSRQMLYWRDELVEAGWDGAPIDSTSPRLHSLSELEQMDIYLAKGRSDRMQEIFTRLESISSISISSVHLHEDYSLLPPFWKKLFDRLKKIGVYVEVIKPPAQSQKSSSNLKSVQKILDGQAASTPLKNDDNSLLMIKASEEWEAAENLAIWLAADKKNNKDVTIICGSDTYILDQALERHGLPKLGNSDSSRWRSSLQVLPLVLANAWKPVDIYRLVELLSLPLAPIPIYASRRLLRALSKEPGVGGDAWNKALEVVGEEHKEKEEGRGAANRKKTPAEFVSRLDDILARDRYLPDSGIPEDKLKERCQWVIELLGWRVEKEPFLVEAVSHCREMQRLAEGKRNIPRVAVERMLDSVIGTGGTAPDRFEQAASWKVVNQPGQITGPCGTIIWWNFIDIDTGSAAYWSRSERADLLKYDIELEDSMTCRRRDANSWLHAFNCARDHFLVFYPQNKNGEAAYHHPFWDEIRTAAFKANSSVKGIDIDTFLIRECHDINNKGSWKLAGRTITLKEIEPKPIKKAVPAHLIPGKVIGLPASTSYSQMSTMIGCPLKWVLEYHAGLDLPDTQAIPSGNVMIGLFCHRIVHELYKRPVRQWNPEAAAVRAGALYDSLVGSMASELLLEGKELENRRYRQSIIGAVRELVSNISKLGLVVESSEERLEGELRGIPFTGFADLILRDKKGNPFVLDLKWSGSSRYKKQEVEDGDALQLAAYAWLLKAADPKASVGTGYFMLAQGELLSDSGLLKDNALESEHTLEAIWEMGVKSWDESIAALKGGRVDVPGVAMQIKVNSEGVLEKKIMEGLKSECAANGMLYQKPLCGFCDFTVLCGLSEAGL
jgi:ATP-dependent helicase/nuclease subunit B